MFGSQRHFANEVLCNEIVVADKSTSVSGSPEFKYEKVLYRLDSTQIGYALSSKKIT
jgi:hypothetical protein